VLRVCRETAGGKAQSGHVVLGLADRGIGLTNFTYTKAIVGPSVIAELERLRAEIVAGRIHVPESRAALQP
jgi:basic membrane lipoprotein Med (substrate-binding protein (PBP1-ABC) superfamily)